MKSKRKEKKKKIEKNTQCLVKRLRNEMEMRRSL